MKIELKEGDVWYAKKFSARHKVRRIVGIRDGLVFFSAGGDRIHHVKRASFIKWRGVLA